MLLALVAASTLAIGLRASAADTSFRRAVVVRGLADPVDIAATASQPTRLYVVEQRGTIRVVDRGKLRPGFFLDVRRLVSFGGEQGLLGLAFDPRYASNRFVYVNYTDRSGNTRVMRYRTNGTRVLPSTAKQLLEVDQPYANHNGGDVVFGPDGRLYVGMGDGGSEGDPQKHAQNPSSLLGKLLSLDVHRPGSPPVIVGDGLRNPWRFSFDRKTGDLYIGDVGQNEIEEVDFTPRSSPGLENYGWNLYEGSQRYSQNTATAPGKLVFPVDEYHHDRRQLHGRRGLRLPRAGTALGAGPVHLRRLLQRASSGACKIESGAAKAVRVEPFRIPGL